MTSVKVHLNKYRSTQNGTYPLVIQLIHQRKKKNVSTPYHLSIEDFDEKLGKAVIRGGRKNNPAEEINQYLFSETKELWRIINHLEKQRKEFTVLDIARLYRPDYGNGVFKTYAEKLLVKFREQGKGSTADLYQSTLNKILLFQGQNHDLTFADIDIEWLESFREHLLKSGLQDNSVFSYLRILRSIYNRAEKEGICQNIRNPFLHQRFFPVPAVKHVLDQQSVRKITEANLSDDQALSFARDLFLFSYYTHGMSFMDMAYLKKEDIHEDVIWYRRSRNKQLTSVKMTPLLHELINKYDSEGEYVFPVLRPVNIDLYDQYRTGLRRHNNQLKKLASLLELSCPLSSHVALNTCNSQSSSGEISLSIVYEGKERLAKASFSSLEEIRDSVLNALSKLTNGQERKMSDKMAVGI